MIHIKHFIYITMLFCSYSASTYSSVLDVRNGTLFGASEVNVNDVLYDVQFKDGTCIELYNGCNENTDFLFTNPENLNDGVLLGAAMQALLDQVFVDSSSGLFDNKPDLMNGCNVPGGCNIASPLWVNNGSGSLGVFVTHNWTPEHRDVVSAGGGSKTFDTRPVPGLVEDISVYAVWKVSEVPIPAAVWLFGSGLIGLVGMRAKLSTRPKALASPKHQVDSLKYHLYCYAVRRDQVPNCEFQ